MVLGCRLTTPTVPPVEWVHWQPLIRGLPEHQRLVRRVRCSISFLLTEQSVVRPSRTKPDAKLPILVWIYGGGFEGGGTSDPRYNMSALVRLSQDMGKPILGGRSVPSIHELGWL